MKLIDKDALVAKIESLRRATFTNFDEGVNATVQTLLETLNTLEVKEDNLLTEKKNEKELAEIYINIFDKKFGNKLPQLKRKQLAEFKNFINTCEQTFHIKYFDYHATQGKLFEKLALLWAVWGKEHLNLEGKEVDLEKELIEWHKKHFKKNGTFIGMSGFYLTNNSQIDIAKHFFELGLKAQKGEKV